MTRRDPVARDEPPAGPHWPSAASAGPHWPSAASAGPHWPSAASAVVGVIGDPVAHSLSPLLHNRAFAAMGLDWVSVGFWVRAGDGPAAVDAVRALGVRGLSVTMPHKEAVVSVLDRLTPVAEALGAVNCIWRDGSLLVGDNTDGEGFLAALARAASFDPAGRRCVVAGAGGAARAVVKALGDAGALEVTVVNRSPGRAAAAASLAGAVGRVGASSDAARADLVVDATPVGMAGVAARTSPPLLDPVLLGTGQLAVDLVYFPTVTPWLAAAAAGGARTLGGLGMLVHQAAAQVRRWTGATPPVAAMWSAVAPATDAASPAGATSGSSPGEPPATSRRTRPG